MKFTSLQNVELSDIQKFRDTFRHTPFIIHGSNQLQSSRNLNVWYKDIKILEKRDYKGKVKTNHYILVDDEQQIVGISDIKHRLTSYTQKEGGHISYSISPDHHCKGYGKVLLNKTLIQATMFGFQSVLLTCKENNTPSKKVILANGGEYIGSVNVNHYMVEHYLIRLDNNNFIM